MNCDICGGDALSWTDTHGIAQCTRCGVGYLVIHYDEQHHMIPGEPPKLMILPEYIDLIKQYWSETHRIQPSGFSYAYRNNSHAQELATKEDAEAFDLWMAAHPIEATPKAKG